MNQRRFLGQNFIFDQQESADAINLKFVDGKLNIKTPEVLLAMSMAGGTTDTLQPNQWQQFEMRKLYSMGELRIVLTDVYENGKVDFTAYQAKT